jgi:hypothetical protein
MEVHLSNFAADQLTDKLLLHTMWEDTDLEGESTARERFGFINNHAPDAFVLVRTADYITAPCQVGDEWPYTHGNCETYDPTYCLYLVPAAVWAECSEEINRIDDEWRNEQRKCRISGKVEPMREVALVTNAVMTGADFDDIPF